MKKNSPKRKVLGRYIVADPEICHGQPTFKGTRIMVWQVLEQIADGLSWETIVKEWRGDVTLEAIAEAVRVASTALAEQSETYRPRLSAAKRIAV
jgi:uncharacterized protein (DUF433 family)